MKETTLAINHSAAPSDKKCSTSSHLKTHEIHSAAFNVTTNAQHQVFEKYGMCKVWEEGIQMAQQYLLTTHSRQQQRLKGKRFRSEYLVGSRSCQVSDAY